MCKGTNCHLKEQCYRFTANRSMLQYYFATPPIKDGKCSHFWDSELPTHGRADGLGFRSQHSN